MAEAAKRRYGEGAVYGSLAYDFDYPEIYSTEEYAQPRTAPAKPKTREKVHTAAQTRQAVRTKQSIAPTAILGVLVSAFLLISGITAQVRLMNISNETVELQSQLEELKIRQAKLRIGYESAFNLAEIEEYATETLGMQKPNANQIAYIDTSSPDKAVVVNEGGVDSFVDRVSDFLTGLGAYF